MKNWIYNLKVGDKVLYRTAYGSELIEKVQRITRLGNIIVGGWVFDKEYGKQCTSEDLKDEIFPLDKDSEIRILVEENNTLQSENEFIRNLLEKALEELKITRKNTWQY